MSPNTTQSLILAARIIISLSMFAFGAILLFMGKLALVKHSVKGTSARVIGGVLIVGSALFFLYQSRGFFHQYTLLIQVLVLLAALIALWIIAEKPAAHKPLPAATHIQQSGPDEPAYRLHLRLQKDGSGLLVVNASTILHLNPSAAEYAMHMMKGTAPEEAAKAIAQRYNVNKDTALKDFSDFRDRIQTLIHTPDLDPVTFLGFDRITPHSKELTAPLRLDCALTYRLPAGTQAEYAPTKRVDRELSTDEWNTIMDKAWSAGIPHLTFTGGEPTLRDDLPVLIAHAEKNGQVCGLLTDGLKLANQEYLQTLLQTGLDHLLFILQPEEPQSWKALETIMSADIFTTVHFTVTPKNNARADEVLAKMAKLEVKSLSLSSSDPSLKEDMQRLRERAPELGMTVRWDLPVPYSADNPVAAEVVDDEVPDGAGKAWLYVEPDGDVLPAQGEADKIMGNILKDPWEKIYK
jgi:Radical SAM superfamily/Coenzyme PQQ synthesis protein D (PqqD)